MTKHDHAFPYYRSADDIRRQEFTHRMRGVDEYEVREFLDLLADQVSATESERGDFRADHERLQRENKAYRDELDRLRDEVQVLREQQSNAAQDEINPQAVALFSQAQQVADQLVEEAVQHARDLMSAARNQQREILERAQAAADEAVQHAEAALPSAEPSSAGGSDVRVPQQGAPAHEIEYVRTYARVAQVQLRSVLEALTEQVDKLGELPRLEGDAARSGAGATGEPGRGAGGSRHEETGTGWPGGASSESPGGDGGRVGGDSARGTASPGGGSSGDRPGVERSFVYPRPAG